MLRTAIAGFPRELVVNLTTRQIHGTYKRSTFGLAWTMLNPLVTVAVYALVFRVILSNEIPAGNPSGITNYGMFLVAAVVPWQFGTAALIGQTGSLSANRALLEKVYFPRWTIPLSTLLAALFDFAVEVLVVLVILVTVFQAPEAILWIPSLVLIVLLHCGFLFGVGQILAVFNARFRDTEHLVRIGTQIWFWLTPIIYPLSLVADRDKQVFGIDMLAIYKLNPMVWFIESYRDVLFDLRGPRLISYAVMAAWAIGPMLVGSWYFHRRQASLAEDL